MKSTLLFTFCFLLTAFLPFAGFAQDGKFAIGLMSTVEFNNVTLHERFPYDVKEGLHNSNSINFYFGIGKKFELKTGFLYGKRSYSLKFNPDKSGTNYPGYYATETNAEGQYISIPIVLGLKAFTSGRLSITPGVGVMANFGFAGKTEHVLTDGRKESMEFSSIHWGSAFSPVIEARINYKINESFTLGATPYYRQFFPKNANQRALKMPNSYGIGFEVKYTFK